MACCRMSVGFPASASSNPVDTGDVRIRRGIPRDGAENKHRGRGLMEIEAAR
jgi:hypothetical protein